MTVRDIAREAEVADGVLYNHFADKEELLAHALHAHMRAVEAAQEGESPRPGERTVEANLRAYLERALGLVAELVDTLVHGIVRPADG